MVVCKVIQKPHLSAAHRVILLSHSRSSRVAIHLLVLGVDSFTIASYLWRTLLLGMCLSLQLETK